MFGQTENDEEAYVIKAVTIPREKAVSHVYLKSEIARYSGLSAVPAGQRLAERAAVAIIGSYRAKDYANPDIFFRQSVRMLASFPAFVVKELADADNADGIVRQSKYPPSIAEIGQWCEERVKKWNETGKILQMLLAGLEELDQLKARGDYKFCQMGD